MAELYTIKSTIIQVADAITAAIGIETEIVDSQLQIIGGTGRYIKKIGSYEENGDLNSTSNYATILRTGHEYICFDVSADETYDPKEGELAEIACPIQIENKILGIIGLVAFTKTQQQKIMAGHENFLSFLRRMSELIASKLIETQSNSKLAILLESMPEGLLAMDLDGKIFSCNFTSEILLMKKREQIIGCHINTLFPKNELDPTTIATYERKEIIYGTSKNQPLNESPLKNKRLVFNIIPIPEIGTMLLFQDFDTIAHNAGNISHISNETSFDDIYGTGKKMKDLKNRAAQISGSDSTVLITGESGTGKELFARAIHADSKRKENVFIAINCAAIPDTLLESELFGYEKGAFTGADKKRTPRQI